MNSFSHYAFGAVCEWMFRTRAGIDSDGAGFDHILRRPSPPSPGSSPDNTSIHWVRAHYDSIQGRISSAWRLEDSVFTYDVTVPPNTNASVILPAAGIEDATESGQPVSQRDRIENHPVGRFPVVLRIPAGSYSFRCEYAKSTSNRGTCS